MRDSSIARNYAEALLSLAKKADDMDGWAKMIADFGSAVEQDTTLRRFLESPRVSAAQKNAVITKAVEDRVPRLFLEFLRALLRNRRQMLIPAIAVEYANLVDESVGRVHARVTVARETSAEENNVIARELSRAVGKDVVPHVSVNPAILGGLVVRIGDTVMDGSVRRRLSTLRRKMLK
ncbi:MAG: F0F1 ATP synthase subunit delta [Gemmatimonadaceae bacterium]